MKRKTITLVVYMLVCLSLVSVGFAAWVITGGDKTEIKGNVSADNVVDKSVALTELGWHNTDNDNDTSDDNNIAFGHPSGTATGWLQYDNDGYVEDLEVIYMFYLSTQSGTLKDAISKLVSVSVDVTDTALDNLRNNDKGAQYICAKPVISYFVAEPEPDDDNYNDASFSSAVTTADGYDHDDKPATIGFTTYDSGSFKSAISVNGQKCYVAIKITYSWGSFFGNVNPFNFYNEMENSAYKRKPNEDSTASKPAGGQYSWKEHASTFLGDLYSKAGTHGTEAITLSVKLLGAGEE